MSEIFKDFLTPTLNQIRQSIRGIDDSYNNFWDILAELIQNSVDAINRAADFTQGEIDLYIDCRRKEISIRDNGCGIAPEKLVELLRPFSTDKLEDESQIGEKGVGLKFAYFQSTYFKIITGNDSGSAQAEISDARLWKLQTSPEYLSVSYEKYSEPFRGTEIILKGIENEQLFSLSIPQMKYILRTKTAVGNTSAIWKEVSPIKIVLEMTDYNGGHAKEGISYSYFLPTDMLLPHEQISLDEFEEWLHGGDRTDLEKRTKLRNKVIAAKGSFLHGGYREIRYWACFVPSRRIWDQLCLKEGLATDSLLSDENWLNEKSFVLHRPGIYTAVKGMPTGITVEHPSAGYSGYWSNMFILFEDDCLSFDIGRKSIHGLTANIYKGYAKEIFNRFLQYIVKYVSGSVEPYSAEWNKEALIDEIKALPDLSHSAIKFGKNPKDQEASVAAIFYELIGAGHISDVEPLISGYRSKYDLYAKWNGRTVVIEFKSHLKNIVKDFDDARKVFDEMDYIVCWEVTDEDVEKLYQLSITIEQLNEPSLFSQAPMHISCCTHRLLINANVTPVYIIDLKRFLSSLH
ncbi:MAG: ATP-binding protein [Eubacteriales bacterium]|nr:ATP-binding protein [Eubacteriales bacterium]